MPAAVVFDMDGLIFDTEALYQSAFHSAAKGVNSVPGEFIAELVGLTWVQGKALLARRLGQHFPVDQFFAEMVEHFDRQAATELRLKPGVVELLDVLDTLNIRRCIATSSSHATVQSHLSAHGLVERFHDVVGHGDYASSKPSPEPFLMAAGRLQVAPHLCLALEDSHNGVRSASAAGMMTLMVPDLAEPTHEIAALCAHVVRDLFVVGDLIRHAAAKEKGA